MRSSTTTLPYSQTRPRSLRPRSTSITCSARSFSSASSSRARSRSLLGGGRARARAGDRPLLRAPARHRHERLGRGARDLEVEEVEEVHVRARVHGAQAAVDRERLHRAVRAPALARHHLVGVARADVLLRALDGGRVALRPHVRAELRGLAAPGTGAGHGPGQPLAHVGDRLRGVAVRRLHVVTRHDVRQDRDLVAQVVEGDQHVGDHQREVGHAGVVGVGARRRSARRRARGRSRTGPRRRRRTAAAPRAGRSASGRARRPPARTGRRPRARRRPRSAGRPACG